MLRHLQAANDGYLHSLSRVLETAHGLRGPEKHASLSVRNPSLTSHSPHALDAYQRITCSLSYLKIKLGTRSLHPSLHSSARPFPILLVLRLQHNSVALRRSQNEPTLPLKKLDY